MHYEIHRENKLHQPLEKIRSTLDDCFISLMLWTATVTHNERLSMWVLSYTKRKIERLQREILRKKWGKVTLDKAVQHIREEQEKG